jgi:hypothetical protein
MPFDFDAIRAQAARAPGFPPRRATGTPPPPPPPGPQVERQREIAAARKVLGIPSAVELTEAVIKQHQRKLARKHHPDRGGDVAVMQRINAAADYLLAQLGS